MSEKSKAGKKMMAILVDPDKTSAAECVELGSKAMEAGIDFFFVGSSILTTGSADAICEVLKRSTTIPVILFPGNTLQLSNSADGILFLSLISGRNPDLLIGNHVLAAPYLKKSKLEVIPTGYILIDSGAPTSVSYMSYTLPIPHDKNDIAACTAMAGEMLGLKLIYLDAGSGAKYPVSAPMISSIRKNISAPIIVGGGIRTPEKAEELCKAGADVIVVGNALEKNPNLLFEISAAVHAIHAS
ncbi:MAG: geranylgeranylglyceryl/heptaprenylglyceryl phosphate synthase [Bacteroidia bacterium]